MDLDNTLTRYYKIDFLLDSVIKTKLKHKVIFGGP